MTPWNKPLFSTELAYTVHQIYRSQMRAGIAAEDACNSLMQLYCKSEHSQQDAPKFWLALAATQLECHSLLPIVRNQAIAWINHELVKATKPWQGLKNDEEDCAYLRAACTLKCKIMDEYTSETAEQ